MQTIGEYGPKMKALPNDKWREFAILYCRQGGKDAGKAYAAVYGYDIHDREKRDACYVSGYRLAHDARMLDAILELSEKELRSLAPMANKMLHKVLDDPTAANSDRINAFKTVADRVGLHAKTEHRMTIEHIDNPERLARLAELAARMGVDLAGMVGNRLAAKAPVIDLTPTAETLLPISNTPDYVDDEY